MPGYGTSGRSMWRSSVDFGKRVVITVIKGSWNVVSVGIEINGLFKSFKTVQSVYSEAVNTCAP
jgi:hypothetical protein